jgi:hypothetical protein
MATPVQTCELAHLQEQLLENAVVSKEALLRRNEGPKWLRNLPRVRESKSGRRIISNNYILRTQIKRRVSRWSCRTAGELL